MKWIPVTEQLPPNGQIVLACYRNRLNNWRRIRATWVAAKTLESDVESNIAIYDEATDMYYDPEDWYERIDNWDDFTHIVVHEGTVTHWMPLPEPPHEEQP